jgi:hypothetical protein
VPERVVAVRVAVGVAAPPPQTTEAVTDHTDHYSESDIVKSSLNRTKA